MMRFFRTRTKGGQEVKNGNSFRFQPLQGARNDRGTSETVSEVAAKLAYENPRLSAAAKTGRSMGRKSRPAVMVMRSVSCESHRRPEGWRFFQP